MDHILVVYANPRGTKPLRLGDEDRAIRMAIRRSRERDRLKVERLFATTIHDLRRALLDEPYRIVHISGHGTGLGLQLQDDGGGIYVVPQKALAQLFATYARPRGSLECVLLNACYSMSQGDLISLAVPYTIAMEGAISDRASIEFSRGFYDALGAGLDVRRAYREGVHTIELAAPNTMWKSSLILPDGEIKDGPEWVEDDGSRRGEEGQPEQVEARRREDVPPLMALIGLAVDLSGSMADSIRNDSGGQLTRLESFGKAFERLTKDARNRLQTTQTPAGAAAIDLFAYGFGFRTFDVADLLAVLRAVREAISPAEIDALKNRYAQDMRNRFRGYEGLGDLARSAGLGGFVDQVESGLRKQAEAEGQRRIMAEISGRIERQLGREKEITLPIEEVPQLWQESGESLANAEALIFGNTPLKQALREIHSRFQKELSRRPDDTLPVLFLLSDGEATDGDPLPEANALLALGVTMISCYVTDDDVARPRTLFGQEQLAWGPGARKMFEMASPVDEQSDFARFLLKKGWTLYPQAKLFVQLNHSDILEEFIRVVLSPLEERGTLGPLPRGV